MAGKKIVFSGKDFPRRMSSYLGLCLGLASSFGGLLQNSLMERIYVGRIKSERVLENVVENVVLGSEGPLTSSVTWATPLSFRGEMGSSTEQDQHLPRGCWRVR